jgi:hypothetical protein
MAGRSALTRKQQKKVSAQIRASAPKVSGGTTAAPSRPQAPIEEGPGDTVRLRQAAGSAFELERIGQKAKDVRFRRKPGLDWLLDKGRITEAQRTAGRRYGASFQALEDAGNLKSHLNFTIGGGSGPGIGEDADRRAAHRMWLSRARAFVHFHVGMIRALDNICGKELTPREIDRDRDRAERIEHELRLALDLLVIMGAEREAA